MGDLARSLTRAARPAVAPQEWDVSCSGGFAGACGASLLLVSLMTFALIWLVPGDPASAFLDASATPEQVARLRVALGLDKPLPLQMVDWYGRILRGDLGQSILLNRCVAAALLERLPVTLSLAACALAFAVVLGVAAGTIAAVNHNRWPDQP